jgi:hypothetical protein
MNFIVNLFFGPPVYACAAGEALPHHEFVSPLPDRLQPAHNQNQQESTIKTTTTTTTQPLLVCTLYTNPHREQRALTCDYSNTLVLACLLFLCPASRMCKQPSVQFVLLLMDLPLTHKIACVGVPFVRLLPLVCSVTPQPQQQKDLGNAVTVH